MVRGQTAAPSLSQPFPVDSTCPRKSMLGEGKSLHLWCPKQNLTINPACQAPLAVQLSPLHHPCLCGHSDLPALTSTCPGRRSEPPLFTTESMYLLPLSTLLQDRSMLPASGFWDSDSGKPILLLDTLDNQYQHFELDKSFNLSERQSLCMQCGDEKASPITAPRLF